MDKNETERVKRFLEEYKALCKKHGCLVLSDGEEVEVSPDKHLATAPDPWGIEGTTISKGWDLR